MFNNYCSFAVSVQLLGSLNLSLTTMSFRGGGMSFDTQDVLIDRLNSATDRLNSATNRPPCAFADNARPVCDPTRPIIMTPMKWKLVSCWHCKTKCVTNSMYIYLSSIFRKGYVSRCAVQSLDSVDVFAFVYDFFCIVSLSNVWLQVSSGRWNSTPSLPKTN